MLNITGKTCPKSEWDHLSSQCQRKKETEWFGGCLGECLWVCWIYHPPQCPSRFNSSHLHVHLCLCMPSSGSSVYYLQDPQNYSARGWISPILPGFTVLLTWCYFNAVISSCTHTDMWVSNFLEMYTKYQFREASSWLLKSCGLVTKLGFVF